jgi:hypothetical protein
MLTPEETYHNRLLVLLNELATIVGRLLAIDIQYEDIEVPARPRLVRRFRNLPESSTLGEFLGMLHGVEDELFDCFKKIADCMEEMRSFDVFNDEYEDKVIEIADEEEIDERRRRRIQFELHEGRIICMNQLPELIDEVSWVIRNDNLSIQILARARKVVMGLLMLLLKLGISLDHFPSLVVVEDPLTSNVRPTTGDSSSTRGQAGNS